MTYVIGVNTPVGLALPNLINDNNLILEQLFLGVQRPGGRLRPDGDAAVRGDGHHGGRMDVGAYVGGAAAVVVRLHALVNIFLKKGVKLVVSYNDILTERDRDI